MVNLEQKQAHLEALTTFSLVADEFIVPEGAAVFISSGNEAGFLKVVCRGKIRVYGKLVVV